MASNQYVSYQGYMNFKPGAMISLPPRQVSWSDLLAEGLEADLRNFQKWLRSWKKPR